MSRRCEVTGITPMAGNNVSHANNRTKRRFLPNLHKRRFWHAGRKQYVQMRVSAKGIRLIDKYGLEAILESMATGRKPRLKQPDALTAKPAASKSTSAKSAKSSKTAKASKSSSKASKSSKTSKTSK